MTTEKDWTGNKKSTFTTLGASNHCEHDRESNDYYATEPKAMSLLLAQESFSMVWECACGEGHLAKVLGEHNILWKATDLIDRGYENTEICDFLKVSGIVLMDVDIITNPPYKYAQEFVEKALNVIADRRKVAMFLKLTFLEGQKRKKMFEKYPPKTIYVSSSRLKCALNGNFEATGESAAAYAWFVWEKGFKGDPIIKWIN